MGCETSLHRGAMIMKSRFTGLGVCVRISLIGMLSLSLLGVCSGGESWAAIRYPTHVAAQGLGPALELLAREHGFQVLYRTEIVRGVRAHPLDGDLSTDQALRELLSGTGLSYRYLGARAITIVPAALASPYRDQQAPGGEERGGSGASQGGAAGGGGRSSSPFRMAQMDRQAGESNVLVTQGTSRRSVEGKSNTSSSLQEIVVTAQKFAQRAFDVPISLAVIDARELQSSLIHSIDDLASVVPGLAATDTGTGLRIAIRGISNVEGQGALVGSYLDDADVTTEENLALNLYTYDLQRVEVLRGPQGTLYGEGSIGGTIRYITNKPALDEVQLGTDVTATFDQYGAPGEQIVAVMNAPIVADRFGLRVAADIDHEGGWMDQPAADQKNVNSRDIADVRIEGLWRPLEDFTVNAMQVIHRAKEGPFVGESTPGVYTQVFGLTTAAHFQDDYDLSNLTMQWQGQSVQVLNSVTYFKHDLDEMDQGIEFPLTPPPSIPYEEYVSSVTIDRSASDELHIESGNESPLHWIVGGFYRNYTDSTPPYVYYFDLPGPPGVLPAPIGPDFTSQSVQSKSISEFGDVSYRFLGRLTVGAGVRHFRDEEHFLQSEQPTQAATFTSTDPRFYMQYGLSGDINLYASAAKGFRSGGFNGYPYPAYGPENVWTYELGSKARLPDRGVSADADVFWSNYNGYQNIGLLPPPALQIGLTRNAGNARIKGIEGDLRWSPSKGWSLGLTADYIEARYVVINVTQSSYDVGDPLDLVPRYQVTASGERDFSWGGRVSFVRLQYSQTAPESFRDRSLGDFYYGRSDYIHLLNLRMGVQWNAELRCEAFAQNALNDRGFTGPFVIEDNSSREQPRTFGIEFAYTLQ